MRKGSITIFSLLSLLLISSVLFGLLEGARVHEIKRTAQSQTELAVESVFAGYHTLLWENYHLLGCEKDYFEETMISIANARKSSSKGLNLLLSEVCGSEIESYTLITDGDGAAYIQAIASYMQGNLLYEAAQNSYSYFEAVKYLKDTSQMNLSSIGTAQQNIEQLQMEIAMAQAEKEKNEKKETEEKEGDSKSQKTSQKSRAVNKNPQIVSFWGMDNPLKQADRWLKTGILELVLPDTSQISGKSISVGNLVSHRSLERGKNSEIKESDWWDGLWLQQYLLSYFSNYKETKENRGLTYELEYVIGGRERDVENLKMVATKLLEIRCVTNFLYLSTDIAKSEEALGLAMTLVGISGNPVLIEGVKVGILTAWAFGEAVLDVRAILAGKKIALLKSYETWTLGLGDLGGLSDRFFMAKECRWGLSYKDYLGILLLFEDSKTIAYRAMDMQELTIQKIYPQEIFQMDKLMIQAEAEIRYKYAPVFSLWMREENLFGEYEFITKASFNY